jgi:HSP20 family protein
MAVERWRPFEVARWEPYRGISDIQGEMNRLFDSFFGRPSATTTPGGRTWAPLVDMYETKDDVVLTFELPGVREKDVNVSITGDLVAVRGERRLESEASEQNLHHLERFYGKFERLVQLPIPVQTDKVKATYRDGVLEVRLPKAEEIKPKSIKIDVL